MANITVEAAIRLLDNRDRPSLRLNRAQEMRTDRGTLLFPAEALPPLFCGLHRICACDEIVASPNFRLLRSALVVLNGPFGEVGGLRG